MRGPRKFSSKYLGPLVTNNVAELKALGMCAEDIYADLVATHPLSPHVPQYICIDNSYTINVADGKWNKNKPQDHQGNQNVGGQAPPSDANFPHLGSRTCQD